MNEGAERAVERRLDGRVVPINTHKNRCGPTLRCEEAPRAATPKTLFWGQAIDKRRRAEAEQTKTGGRTPDHIPSTCDSLMAGRFSFGFWCWWALAYLARCGRVYV